MRVLENLVSPPDHLGLCHSSQDHQRNVGSDQGYSSGFATCVFLECIDASGWTCHDLSCVVIRSLL